MQFTISQRAWEANQQDDILPILHSMGVTALEVAPPKFPGHLLNISDHDLATYNQQLKNYGIEVVAMQSLLSFLPGLALFQEVEARQRTLDTVLAMAPKAAQLGAMRWVFGSFQVRKRGELSLGAADAIMVPWLHELGDALAAFGIQFLLEAVPAIYGADYLTMHDEVAELVKQVQHQNIGFHLDLGTCFHELASLRQLEYWASIATHVHVSIPHFGLIQDEPKMPHALFAQVLAGSPAPYLSIEMFEKVTADGQKNGYDGLKRSIEFVQEHYASVLG